jgi:ABC-type glutathione transport system ATPase component
MAMGELLRLESAWRTYRTNGREVVAVRDVSLAIGEREVVCLVGGSGSGKTTSGKLLTGILAPTRGRVLYRGRDIRLLSGDDWRAFRLGVQLVHQDPFASLNPTMRVVDILSAPLRRHRIASGRATALRCVELLEAVDLVPAEELLDKHPHQLSGGQRQRVAIARALTVSPSVLVADEAVSMVDVSIRLSLLDTLLELRERSGLAVILITHDLALARYFGSAGRTVVMREGAIVEAGPTLSVLRTPTHAYTRQLLAAAHPLVRDQPPLTPT